ncbi:SDR family NAD(P)-dependent oxidoreductase [Cupriavidus pauculus]|jgi:short-subunit dehydrogenase|uniref:SDR family NAD(P)-dependent oxidoreductase n=1 Tax=Cupriavidus pauculus TaxID=82633 RepID=UPI0038578BD5
MGFGLHLNPRLRDWRDKRVWVVGASSGIGAALARALLDKGAWVAVSARRPEVLHAVVAGHPNGVALPMDVNRPSDWTATHHALCQAWQGVDLVVFCAAEYRPLRPWQVSAEEAHHTIETNLCGVYYGLDAILPTMLAQRSGGLAIVASAAGYIGLPNAALYGPTKAALINLAEVLYAELHGHGLGIYLINPGFVKSRLTALNAFKMPALITPETAARDILAGFARGSFEIAFPLRFTRAVRLVSLLPYRISLGLLQRLARTS